MSDVPRAACRAAQNSDVKRGWRSETSVKYEPDTSSQEVDMNLEEVVTRVGRRLFHEVQPNRAPTALGDGQRVQETHRASVFGFDALAGRAGADEGVNVGCEGWPPHRAARKRQCFVPSQNAHREE